MSRASAGKGVLGLGLALAVAFSLRFGVLGVDPPDSIRFGAAWGDEGPWAWPAAFRAVSGSWPEAGAVFVRAAPAHAWPLTWFFHVAPPGLLGARTLSLLAGLGTLTVLWWMCRTRLGGFGAVLATTLYATAFWSVLYERHAAPEAVAVFYATAALAVLLDQRRAVGLAGGLLMAVLAFAAKASLIFFPAFALVAVFAVRGLFSEGVVWSRPLAAGALTVVAAAVVLFGVQLVETFRFVAMVPQPSGTFLHGAAAIVRRLSIAPLHADYFLSMPVGVAGVVLAFGRGVPDSVHGRKLFVLGTLWILCWWMVVPVFDLKGSRYYLITPPFVLLATLGWLGLSGAPWTPLGHLPPGPARHLRRGVRLGLAVWVGALGAIEWSIQGGPAARVSLPFLAALALGLGVALTAGRSGGVAARFPEAWRTIRPVLVAAVVASQLGWWWTWRRDATSMVRDSVSLMSRGPGLGGYVCGDQAPLLLLGQPGRGQALYNVYWPTCAMGGRSADWVVVTEDPLCTPFESVWIGSRRRALLGRRHEVAVNLPGYPPAPGVCLHYVVPLGEEG